MSHVRADVVVHVLEEAVVAVDRGQRTPQTGPGLAAVPWQIVRGVVQVGHDVEPDHEDEIGTQVVVGDDARAQHDRANTERCERDGAAGDARRDYSALAGPEQLAPWIEVGSGPAPRPSDQIQGEGQGDQMKARGARVPRHRAIEALRQRVPRLVEFHVSHMAVMDPMAQSPCVVGDQHDRVRDVPHEIVQPTVARERSVTAVVADHVQREQGGSGPEPEQGAQRPGIGDP
jgi:hypothetical protein